MFRFCSRFPLSYALESRNLYLAIIVGFATSISLAPDNASALASTYNPQAQAQLGQIASYNSSNIYQPAAVNSNNPTFSKSAWDICALDHTQCSPVQEYFDFGTPNQKDIALDQALDDDGNPITDPTAVKFETNKDGVAQVSIYIASPWNSAALGKRYSSGGGSQSTSQPN